jgi:hypothetical protein
MLKGTDVLLRASANIRPGTWCLDGRLAKRA